MKLFAKLFTLMLVVVAVVLAGTQTAEAGGHAAQRSRSRTVVKEKVVAAPVYVAPLVQFRTERVRVREYAAPAQVHERVIERVEDGYGCYQPPAVRERVIERQITPPPAKVIEEETIIRRSRVSGAGGY